jgi:hypothetical protein
MALRDWLLPHGQPAIANVAISAIPKNEIEQPLARIAKIAKIAIAEPNLSQQHGGRRRLTIEPHSSWDREDWQAHYDERYGIALYDGKQTEVKAHELAWNACVVEWLNLNPVNTDSKQCAQCGISNKTSAIIFPFGGGNHHAWLHSDCWRVWQNERYREAEEALKLIGLVRKTQ